MDDVTLWRAAAELMNAFDEGAQGEALRRADAAIDAGDIDGFNRWKRVARLIVEMQSRGRPEGGLH